LRRQQQCFSENRDGWLVGYCDTYFHIFHTWFVLSAKCRRHLKLSQQTCVTLPNRLRQFWHANRKKRETTGHERLDAVSSGGFAPLRCNNHPFQFRIPKGEWQIFAGKLPNTLKFVR
jgi:hypothetical protein